MKTRKVAIVPYYYQLNESDKGIYLLERTVEILNRYVDRVIVVDDGTGISGINGAELIQHGENRKQSEAIRSGLRRVLEDDNTGFIIQSDADMDQNPDDVRSFIQYFNENNINPKDLVLLIGDRYTPSEFKDPIEYRRIVNIIQYAIFSRLGCPVRDSVSGLRAYTSSLGLEFLARSRSYGWGMNTEQVTIAGLLGAKVENINLSYSRKRGSFTKTYKLIENIDAILLHKQGLVQKGLDDIVIFLENIKEQMTKNSNFSFNLKSLGLGDVRIEGRQVMDDSYTGSYS